MLFKFQMTDIRLLVGIAFALVINSAAMVTESSDPEVIFSWRISMEMSPRVLKRDSKAVAAFWTASVAGQSRTMIMPLVDSREPVVRGYFVGRRGGEFRKPFILEYDKLAYLPHLEVGDHLYLIRLDKGNLRPPDYFLKVYGATSSLEAPYVLRHATEIENREMLTAAIAARNTRSNRDSDLNVRVGHESVESHQGSHSDVEDFANADDLADLEYLAEAMERQFTIPR